uniref:Tandem repeat protein 36 n=1 Tax=Ehrlichia canis TaxID=944 RepID=A0A6C0GYF6_EHRCA|nr:tandem repeat protein 36 [Ehrlichia canis]
MLFILMGYCMLHLTTEITNIDFAHDFHIHQGERFGVSSGDLQLDIEDHPGHGYHILFKNNGHVISDLHGVKAEDFNFNMKDHSLNASFLIDPMAPFHELDVNNHPNFFISMHAYQDGCDNCVHGNPSRPAIVNQAQAILSSATEASVVPAAEAPQPAQQTEDEFFSDGIEAEASVVPAAEAPQPAQQTEDEFFSDGIEAEASVVPAAEAPQPAQQTEDEFFSDGIEAEASVVPAAEAPQPAQQTEDEFFSDGIEAEASVVPAAEAPQPAQQTEDEFFSDGIEAEASVVPAAEAPQPAQQTEDEFFSDGIEAEASVVPAAEAPQPAQQTEDEFFSDGIEEVLSAFL